MPTKTPCTQFVCISCKTCYLTWWTGENDVWRRQQRHENCTTWRKNQPKQAQKIERTDNNNVDQTLNYQVCCSAYSENERLAHGIMRHSKYTWATRRFAHRCHCFKMQMQMQTPNLRTSANMPFVFAHFESSAVWSFGISFRLGSNLPFAIAHQFSCSYYSECEHTIGRFQLKMFWILVRSLSRY